MVASLGLTAFSLIVSVAVLRLFFHDPSKPVPSWLRGRNKVKGITCVKPKSKEEEMNSHISLQSQTPLPSAITEYFRTMASKEDENNDVVISGFLASLMDVDIVFNIFLYIVNFFDVYV